MKKKFIIMLILFIFCIGNANASTITYDRNTLNNYGVNKKWKVTDDNLYNILNTPAVNADDKVYDFADILTQEEEKKVYNLTKEFLEETGMELIILTINSSYTYDSFNETIASDFYDYNDFGIDIDHYSGVLLLRNAYDLDPYYNLYMFGEAKLYYSVERADDILDYIYNDFHSGNYYNGLEKLNSELIRYYSKGYAPEYEYKYIDDNGNLKDKYHAPWGVALVISGIATAVIMIILIGNNKMIKKEYKASEYLIKDSVSYTRKEDRFITSHTSSYTSSSSSGGHSSGGSRSGSSGGGHSSGSGRHG